MSAPPPDTRSVLLVAHTGRAGAVRAARQLTSRLCESGVRVRTLADEAIDLDCAGAVTVTADEVRPGDDELIVALGGDGTLLRAAELARPAATPLLGVNLGHVGFLAEADRLDLDLTAERIRDAQYDVEERLTLEVLIVRDHEVVDRDWALNEASVEKAERERMIDVVLEIDGRPLSRWGCDGLVCATPTGSTAYAFSAGGPVVWPSVQALLVVPLSAHALFSRPLVVAPSSRIAVEIADGRGCAVMFCDGRRTHEVQAGDRIEVSRSDLPIKLVRLRRSPFTNRLVDRFKLPVDGWRGRPDSDD